jgi:magnesium-transporting ATPase (P-type)
LRKIDYEYIIAVTGIGFIVFFAAFFNPFVQDDNARRMIVFCVLVLVQTFTYADVWVSHHPLQTSLGLLKSRYFLSAFCFALILQLVVATVPPIANAFKVGPISFGTYALAVLYASSSLIILEGIKTGRLVLLGRTKKG